MDDAKPTINKGPPHHRGTVDTASGTETAIENSVTVFHIDGDEIKGRIIGREGRNIRALPPPPLHVEAEAFGYLAGAYHGIVLSSLCLLEFLDVGRLGEAEYPLGLGCIAPCRALHSQLGKSSGKGNGAYIMAGHSLYGHKVAGTQRQVGGIAVIAFARILELHLYNVARSLVAGDIGKPVEAVQFAATAVIVATRRILSRFRCFRFGGLNIVPGGSVLGLIPVFGIAPVFCPWPWLIWQSLPNESRGLR